jgi:hypothetical protein
VIGFSRYESRQAFAQSHGSNCEFPVTRLPGESR